MTFETDDQPRLGSAASPPPLSTPHSQASSSRVKPDRRKSRQVETRQANPSEAKHAKAYQAKPSSESASQPKNRGRVSTQSVATTTPPPPPPRALEAFPLPRQRTGNALRHHGTARSYAAIRAKGGGRRNTRRQNRARPLRTCMRAHANGTSTSSPRYHD